MGWNKTVIIFLLLKRKNTGLGIRSSDQVWIFKSTIGTPRFKKIK